MKRNTNNDIVPYTIKHKGKLIAFGHKLRSLGKLDIKKLGGSYVKFPLTNKNNH